MKYVLTDADKLELAQIEADARDVKDRRKRFFSKLRQRAYRERLGGGGHRNAAGFSEQIQ